MRRLLMVALLILTLAGCEQPSPEPQLVAISATWCGPCQRDKPLLSEIAAEGFSVTVIDFDTEREMALSYGATALPTYIVYDDTGQPVERTADLKTAFKVLRFLRSLRR